MALHGSRTIAHMLGAALVGWALVYPMAKLLRRARALDTPLRSSFIAGGLFYWALAFVAAWLVEAPESYEWMKAIATDATLGTIFAWWLLRRQDGKAPPAVSPPPA